MNRAILLRVLIVALLVAAIGWAYVHRAEFDVAALERWVRGAGPWAPLAFMAVYVLATVLFIPGSVLTLAGGALFGPVAGTFYNLTGATIGATLAFLIARYLASDWVARKAGGRVKQLIEGVEQEDWRFIAFVRLVPLFPFNLLNYALGLTRIKLARFVVVSYLTMLPGALAYTYLGYAGREAAAGGGGMIQKGLLALALLATVMFLPRIIARLRRVPMIDVVELQRRLAQGENATVLDVRDADEYRGPLGHIEGARNIPVKELPRRLGELEQARGRPLAIVCRTDKRSVQAARLLSRAGFGNVVVVQGGMEQWVRLSQSPARPRQDRGALDHP
ncbi:MAG: VTT domain-containing protein [Gammaproteobacteria bacterium]|nr:VTT domain-containing protein [Gammaproteobacteria bacterium]